MTDLSQDPIVNVLYKGNRRGVDVAIENGCFGSAIILLLSAIDAMAYVAMPDGQEDVTRSDFIKWGGQYIRFPGREQLSGADLYGARCAMLHAYGAHSKMSRKGECRVIIWADQSDPLVVFDPEKSSQHVVVSISGLRDAFFKGLDQFLIDLYKNPNSNEARPANQRLNTLVHTIPLR